MANNEAVPVLVDDELTIPAEPETMEELVYGRPIVPELDWDCLNGVDDRGGW